VPLHLGLVWALAVAHVKAKDQSTVLGFAWNFLNPLLLLGLLYLFFNAWIGKDVPFYPIFLLIGLVHFTHYSNATSAACPVLATMRHLTCDTIFPKALLVMASVLASSVEFIVAMLACLVVAAVAGVQLSPAISLLPFVLLLQIWTVVWISLLLAAAHAFVQDIGHIYHVFLRALFFITPIFYTAEFVSSGPAAFVLAANPLTHLIQFSRSLIIGGEPFSFAPFVAIAVVNVVATVVSLALFRAWEPSFAERL
jgi:ABC-2 type transport system permease protein